MQSTRTLEAEDAVGYLLENVQAAPEAAQACRRLADDVRRPSSNGPALAADLRVAAEPAVEAPWRTTLSQAGRVGQRALGVLR